MKVEIIAIGDEIISGDIVNTNPQFLSEELWQHGFKIEYHTTIRDDEEAIKEAFLRASERVDIVVTTGGLGPTMDDFTVDVAAKAFDVPLIEDEETMERLHAFAKKRNKELSENSKKQAFIPKGGKTFPNDHGTAPCIYYNHNETNFYFLPGVPREMKHLFGHAVLPDVLEKRKEKLHFRIKYLQTFGMAEAHLDDALVDLSHDRTHINNARIGFRTHFPETTIKVSVWNEDEKQAEADLEKVSNLVKERIGKYVYSEKRQDSLENVLVNKLIEKKKNVAVAESCTGGLIANRITNISGSSEVFKGGVVSYSNEMKKEILGVKPETLDQCGAVSEECAEEMVRGLYDKTGADFCAAVTGIAGPSGGTDEKPVGTVHVAILCDGKLRNKKYFFQFPRLGFKTLVASVVLKKFLRACEN